MRNIILTVACISVFSTSIYSQVVPKPDHVVILMLENQGCGDMMAGTNAPYIKSLANDPSTAVGIEQNNLPGNKTVSIWPIPANENFYISLGSTIFDKGLVSIYDLTGKLVKKVDIDIEIGSTVSKIDATNLISGIYIVKISSTEINFTKKIVMQ